ncbi:AAA family ATPase [Streptomyces sp. KL2]|uniref:AAA family ATPase n=1 Tax=Streptomyces sp. KL2 TaxID=3050126 RepID=UPI00397C8785
MSRRVESIAVTGHKSIRATGLTLGPITVLVGPNGAGKSNFIDAVELLGRIADGDLRMEVGLRGCRVHHFHDTTRNAPVKQAGYASDSEALRPDAGNLAAFLMRLREGHSAEYRKIVRTVRSVAPFFRDFVLTEDSGGRVRLRWKQFGSDTVLPAEALSDGTLRFVCLTRLEPEGA